MDQSGKVFLGKRYGEKMAALRRLTGETNDGIIMRAVVDQVIFDAAQQGITQAGALPLGAIGVKEHAPTTPIVKGAADAG